ncbi:REH1 Cytoplasmic 60S subunit biogenesis factor REH1 [Candida maltosa Xu316]|uniref:C2H2-type domain-containing protein n=1 Tax=Candida maltosa (strain Xu316) TaxID=1245528 RepID=M3J7S7_CANMX|nr:hypothetical protein G210_1381 [Candida maltosa Xu316]
MSFMPNGSNPETASFTCNTCGVKFLNAELQRQHMKTEWHRYNLKRRVANLPSITSEVFAEKIINSKHVTKNENEDEYGFYIATRKKKNNHGERQVTKKFLKSQKNRGRREEILGDDHELRSASPAGSIASEFSQFSFGDVDFHEVESVQTGSELNYTEESDFTDIGSDLLSDEEIHDEDDGEEHEDESSSDELDAIPITHCFYCGANNHEIENNIKHMFSKHGLYIPERSFLVDVEGLLEYLSEVVSLDHECLVCGFEGKNLESIRQHIVSKGHCKIPYETKEEKLAVAEFYDFIGDDDDEQQTSTKTEKATRKHVGFSEESPSTVLVDYTEEEQPEDNGINDNYALVEIDPSGVELRTPTGSRIGHRTMQRYYRQNIQLPREYTPAQTTQALVDRRYSPGLTPYQVTRQEKEVRRIENNEKNKHERKTNKTKKVNFQKHFRDEILGT